MVFHKKKRKNLELGNLDRFKKDVNKFSSRDGSEEWKALHGLTNQTKQGKGKVVSSRKQRRKEERLLKKMRICAFKQHKPIPTAESIQQDKNKEAADERGRKRKERKRLKKKEKRKQGQVRKQEEEETNHKELVHANKMEDKVIKQLEKHLKLNKRKSENLPQAFCDDGLDYILDVLNPKKISSLDTEEEDHTWANLESDDDSSGTDLQSEAEEEEEEEASDALSKRMSAATFSPLGDSKETRSILKQSQVTEKADDKNNKKNVHFGTHDVVKTNKGTISRLKDGIDRKNRVGSVKEDMDDQGSVNISLKGKSETSPPTKANEGGMKSITGDEAAGVGVDDSDDDDEAGEASGEPLQDNEQLASDDMVVNYKEDIYGRLQDKQGNLVDGRQRSVAAGTYIPPAKRARLDVSSDERQQQQMERLKKQMKGMINRLSESNLQPISGQIEQLFRVHSRAQLCEALTEIILSVCVSTTLVPERLVMEHMLLVAVLHGNIGSEVGAHFLQTLATKFNVLCEAGHCTESKEIDNLLVLLAHLYNFKVAHSLLIFDITRKLSNRFAEKDIELLLILLRSVGFTLRKDDPVALKELIVEIQSKAARVNTASFTDQSRVKFMLEVIAAVRTNNMRKIPNYDPSHTEHLRKLLHNYVKGSVSSDSQLRISLHDLLSADEQGRWWQVGSAWTSRQTDNIEPGATVQAAAPSQLSASMLQLAHKQRMNTDVRKNIFCIIMTSEDFVDAFEKLLRLGLKQQQEREIIHVVVHLCLQEKHFNPFYAYLAQKLCEYDRRFQMTVQFSVWDKFKEIHKMTEQKLSNMALFLVHLIATKALSLSLFKVVEFGELDQPRVRLMKKVLHSLLTDYPEGTTREVFNRIAPFPKLLLLREGLKLFMRHFLLRKKGNSDTDQAKQELKVRVGIAEKALLSADSKLRL